MFVVDVASGELRPLTDDEVAGQELISRPVSPDGRRAIVHRNDGYFVLPVDGGAPAKVEGLSSAQIPLGWLDADSLLVRQPGLPSRITVVQPDGRKARPWRDLKPPDAAGVADIPWVYVALDPGSGAYAYSYEQIMSELFLVRGVE